MWRFIGLLLLPLVSFCDAMDAVVLSTSAINDQTISQILKMKQKVLVVGVKDFSLEKFNVHIGAYSKNGAENAFAEAIRQFKDKKFLPSNELIEIPSANQLIGVRQDLAASNDTRYLNIASLDKLDEYLKIYNVKLNDYDTVIISSQNPSDDDEAIVIRRKRVSSDVTFDGEETVKEAEKQSRQLDASAKQLPMPVVLPPYLVRDSSIGNPATADLCLLYLEALNLIVYKFGASASRNLIIDQNNGANTFGWSKQYVNCQVNSATSGSASFTIEIVVGKDMTATSGSDGSVDFTLPKNTISLNLNFVGVQNNGYWSLSKVELLNGFTVRKGNFLEKDLTVEAGTVQATNLRVGSVYQYCYACSQTSAVFFNVSGDEQIWMVGIGFSNFEVDLKILNKEPRFSWLVSDCVGSFSAGSWMGIVCAAVFITILLFGYLMVQSIQTLDRFDDAKQKGITINFKE